MLEGEIAVDDPRSSDVRALLDAHLAFCKADTPPEDVHALDIDGLLDRRVTLFSFRDRRKVLAVAALKQLNVAHGEVKTMHTAPHARGRGVGRALLDHIVAVARHRGLTRISLETGTQPTFAAARSMYASVGFERCGPFGDYSASPNSTFMTLSIVHPTTANRDARADDRV